jgi:hypothetical protein
MDVLKDGLIYLVVVAMFAGFLFFVAMMEDVISGENSTNPLKQKE